MEKEGATGIHGQCASPCVVARACLGWMRWGVKAGAKGLEELFIRVKAFDAGKDLARKNVLVAMLLICHVRWGVGKLHEPAPGLCFVEAGEGLYFFQQKAIACIFSKYRECSFLCLQKKT
ncbi:hypothetical protein KSB_68820 [Ktedonobacter robiniae]|uniref:Uncharacterized protein n=1 Tax=Ktedonobacter robiniae TaxID=2778365 RepID=A0ABQ3V1E7_9CHLR|nr:hypothetical protein KSB_68820 [Ktedonobacter robiniae]